VDPFEDIEKAELLFCGRGAEEFGDFPGADAFEADLVHQFPHPAAGAGEFAGRDVGVVGSGRVGEAFRGDGWVEKPGSIRQNSAIAFAIAVRGGGRRPILSCETAARENVTLPWCCTHSAMNAAEALWRVSPSTCVSIAAGSVTMVPPTVKKSDCSSSK
jgi:hypothetical protein